MKTKFTLLLWTLILSACSQGIASTLTLPAIPPTMTPFQPADTITTTNPLPEIPTTNFPDPKFIVTVSTPHIDPGPNGELPQITPETPASMDECGYQWAYQDLRELTTQFDAVIKNLIPNSTSHATAFGENCIASNGQVVRFAAMETDFYVFVSVNTLDDSETFGNWISDVMQVVDGIPAEEMAGPKPGFVEFRFEKSVQENIGFRVPIQRYLETADGKTGEELFRLFYTSP